MNVPQEIAQKYNFLKQQTFESLGLQFSPAVITYVPPPPTSGGYNDSMSQPYSSASNYNTVLIMLQIINLMASWPGEEGLKTNQ